MSVPGAPRKTRGRFAMLAVALCGVPAAATGAALTQPAPGTLRFTNNANLGDAAGSIALGDSVNKGTLSYEGATASMTRALTLATGGGEIRSALPSSSAKWLGDV